MNKKYKVNEVMKTVKNGDQIIYHNRGIYIKFEGKRRVISTSVLHGGIQENLQYVFNYNCLADEYECSLAEFSYEEELKKNARELGLDDKVSSGISTAAWVEFASLQEIEDDGLVVTAIVTAGVDKNAVRVGDPASYYEKDGKFTVFSKENKITPGTINVILLINKDLAPGVLARALVTCTEAKVCAIQELMIGSLYSNGIATGSGTDGTIIVSDITRCEQLTDAGEHSKLGEMIGRCVKKAVKEALFLQTGANPARQHKLSERGKRYGITIGSLWSFYELHRTEFETISQVSFSDICKLEQKYLEKNTDSTLVVWLSLYLHLIDQYDWGLLEWGEVLRESKVLSSAMLRITKEYDWIFSCTNEDLKKLMIEQAKGILIMALNE